MKNHLCMSNSASLLLLILAVTGAVTSLVTALWFHLRDRNRKNK